MLEQEYDVIIVGARVAGSVTAALLGDAGHRLLLVDRATFPSPTLSTHYFRGERMVKVLKQLGVLEKVLALGCPPLKIQYVYKNGRERPTTGPPEYPGEIGFSLSVQREPLDHILIQRARQSPTTHIAEGTVVTDLLREEDRVVGVRLQGKDGPQSIRARIVIGADGRYSHVADAVAAEYEESNPAYRIIYYLYVRDYVGPNGEAPDGPEFSFLEDEIAYVFPSNNSLACIALSINLSEFAWMKKASNQRFTERIARHQGIAGRFNDSTPEGKILAGGHQPNYVREPVGPGWALVGDAGIHMDPWSGHGMDLASTHATFLAEAIVNWFDNGATEEEALAAYHEQRNEHAIETYQETVTLARNLRPFTKSSSD